MYRGGELEVELLSGSVVLEGRFTSGGAPRLRFDVEDGVVVAKDYPSLIMLSAYRQFDVALEAAGTATGISAERIASELGLVEIYFEPAITISGDVSGQQVIKLNAFYVEGQGQFGLAQRSSLETVPLGANLLVIAHEVGHSLFELSFFEGTAGECVDGTGPGRLTVEFAIRGINEGYADFVSFAVTGATNLLADLEALVGDDRSFRQRFHVRDMDRQRQRLRR